MANDYNLPHQTLVVDLVENILRYADNPGKSAEYITNQIRELIGVRMVALLSFEEMTHFQLLSICPPRKEADWSRPEIQSFVTSVLSEDVPRLYDPAADPIDKNLLPVGIGKSFVIPLMVGNEKVGMLILLDLLDEGGDIQSILFALTKVARVLALILKNSLLYKILEKRVEERTAELIKSESRVRSILQTAMDGIWLTDINGRFIEVNETYCQMSGYSMWELLSMSISDVVSDESARDMAAHLQRVMELGQDRFKSRHRRKDGTEYSVGVSVQYRPTDGGQLVAFIQDLTDLIRSEEEKQKLEAQLQQLQKMESVGRLAGGVAHDFNNMLTAMLGHAELGRMRLDPSHPVYTDLEEISKAAERSADLTRQLLAFARKQTIAPKVLDLNVIVTEMLKMLQRLIGEDIRLTWQPAPNLWKVRIDPSQIDQILVNLCVNARDAIRGTGRITISTANTTIDSGYCATNVEASPGEYVCLTISDSGCGMDKETQSRIFEPFYTTKELGKGTGLGLSTVYGAVKQNGGFINIYSEPGQGTTFSIYLPQDESSRNSQVLARAVDTPTPRGQETILLVEDEPAILKITTIMLEKQGYTVLKAETPGEAARLAREHIGEIQLLMTDVIMPEINGRDLAKNLLPIYPNMKCLFMSGYTADVIAHHGVLEEGVHFIQKPFSLSDMAAKVRKVLDSN